MSGKKEWNEEELLAKIAEDAEKIEPPESIHPDAVREQLRRLISEPAERIPSGSSEERPRRLINWTWFLHHRRSMTAAAACLALAASIGTWQLSGRISSEDSIVRQSTQSYVEESDSTESFTAIPQSPLPESNASTSENETKSLNAEDTIEDPTSTSNSASDPTSDPEDPASSQNLDEAEDSSAKPSSSEDNTSEKLNQTDKSENLKSLEESASDKIVPSEDKNTSDIKPSQNDSTKSVKPVLSHTAKNNSVSGTLRLADSCEAIYQQYTKAQDSDDDADTMASTASMGKESDSNLPQSKGADSSLSQSETADISSSSDQMASVPAFSKLGRNIEGVDGSDIIRTDGDYIYTCREDEIEIVDIRQSKMKPAATIKPDLGTNGSVIELFLDGNRLYAVVSIDTSADGEVRLITYDISRRTSPKELGFVEQDGSYENSYKKGDYIYLFSARDLSDCTDKSQLIPRVNGIKLDASCIYISDGAASSELVVTAIHTKKPKEPIDELAILHGGYRLSVDTDSFFLCGTPAGKKNKTEYIRFRCKNGTLNGEAAATIRGTATGGSAVYSFKKGLLVLTTINTGKTDKHLITLLDSKLKKTGSLNSFAKGKEICSVYCIGNTAYITASRDTGFLYTLDLSSPSKPKQLSCIKLDGSCVHLRSYGDGLLLGIDENNARLAIMDISDPKKPKLLDSVYCDGLEIWDSDRALLADPSKNLIGIHLITENENDENNILTANYQIFRWKKNKLQTLTTIHIPQSHDAKNHIRGLYAGDHFYLLTQNSENGTCRLCSYDIKKQFAVISKLIYD